MEFLLIFSEVNFVEIPKICDIHEIYIFCKMHLFYFCYMGTQLQMFILSSDIRTYVHIRIVL